MGEVEGGGVVMVKGDLEETAAVMREGAGEKGERGKEGRERGDKDGIKMG